MSKLKNLIGQRFGMLTVVSIVLRDSPQGSVWNCRCDCGGMVVRSRHRLTENRPKHCGCMSKELASTSRIKHGQTVGHKPSREYRSWDAMIQRCTNPNHKHYKNYGGRGIKVCNQWLESAESFLKDMGLCPEGFTLDRLDVDEDYTPENCRWVARKDQDRNKRNTVWVEWEGKLVQLRALAEKFNLPRSRVYQQWKRGKPLTEIFVI